MTTSVESLRAHHRLRGTVYVPPGISRGELREMSDVGVVGIRLFRSVSSFGALEDLQTHEYRLVWGSDAPFVGHEGTVTYKDRLDSYLYAIPKPATRHAIDRTALALYFS